MIFAAHQLQEKCQEMRTHLYTIFVDPMKAFDTVNRDGRWKVLQKFGCPERFTHMVRQLHDGMTACVTDNGTVSEGLRTGPLCYADGRLPRRILRDLHRLRYGRPTPQPTADALPLASPQPTTTYFSSLTTAHSMQRQKRKCKGAWTSSPQAPPILD
ncbi:unnamed protein product [Schistocephalus solidus]|uniref:Reverse transcriptase domain-containing protein n=1 Tax=Schistocephalus solidus TaxID=70667 RepID=A0A183SR67_SCHSO|nr:unnamed protein product [Schistocephalus solidus]